MNTLEGIVKWEVDLTKPVKILKVESLRDNEYEIIKVLGDKGYSCEKTS